MLNKYIDSVIYFYYKSEFRIENKKILLQRNNFINMTFIYLLGLIRLKVYSLIKRYDVLTN